MIAIILLLMVSASYQMYSLKQDLHKRNSM